MVLFPLQTGHIMHIRSSFLAVRECALIVQSVRGIINVQIPQYMDYVWSLLCVVKIACYQ